VPGAGLVKGAEPEEESFFKKFRTDRPRGGAGEAQRGALARDLAHPIAGPAADLPVRDHPPGGAQGPRRAALRLRPLRRTRIDPATDDGRDGADRPLRRGRPRLKTPPVYVLPSDDSGLNFAAHRPAGLFLGARRSRAAPPRPSPSSPACGSRTSARGTSCGRSWPRARAAGVALRGDPRGAAVLPRERRAHRPGGREPRGHQAAISGPSLDVLTSLVTKVVQSTPRSTSSAG
jgi:hypothetical protein